MKTKHLILLLITGLIITSATTVIAKTGKTMRHIANSGFSPLAQIVLSAEQTEKIRELRMAFEESIMPLKLQEHQVKAELDAADIIRQLKFLYKMLSEIELKEEQLSDF